MVPERWRIRFDYLPKPGSHKLVTRPHEGLYGAFYIPGPCAKSLLCIASDGSGWAEAGLSGTPWEHVSVSTDSRPPNWQEMTFVKDAFWGDEDCVVQFHPPRSDYIDIHPHCLHLWRPLGIELPRPPSITVGPRGAVPAPRE